MAKARENLRTADLSDLVDIREGDALETLARDLPETIDLVLLDGAKGLYSKVLSDGSHVFVAMRKALTALQFQMPSSKANELVPKDPSLLTRVTPNMFVEGGALPIAMGKETVGAIGVSGAGGSPIGHLDEVCAAAGLRKIESMRP